MKITNHVNEKHASTKEYLRTRTGRGTHIEKPNGPVRLMGKTTGESDAPQSMTNKITNGQKHTVAPKCPKTSPWEHRRRDTSRCISGYGGIHLPYRPSAFATIGESNIHIYLRGICQGGKIPLAKKNRPKFGEICVESIKREDRTPPSAPIVQMPKYPHTI